MKNPLKFILQKTDDFWEYLNIQDSDPKIQKAKQEIITITYLICFLLSSFIIQIIALRFNPLYTFVPHPLTPVGLKVEKGFSEEGTGFIFFVWAVVFSILAFAVSHTRNSHKHQTLHNPKENSQPQHE